MRLAILGFFGLFIGPSLLAVDSSQAIIQPKEKVPYTHAAMVQKAASYLRVRQMQKLVNDEKWSRRDKVVKKSELGK